MRFAMSLRVRKIHTSTPARSQLEILIRRHGFWIKQLLPSYNRTRRYLALCVLLISCSRSPHVRKLESNQREVPYNRLLFGGDVMFCRAVRRQMLALDDPALPFRKVAPLMRAADITFVNLESPFS